MEEGYPTTAFHLNQPTRLIIFPESRDYTMPPAPHGETTYKETGCETGSSRLCDCKRRPKVPAPARLEPYRNLSLSARKSKRALVVALSKLSGGDLRKLMPECNTPGQYKRPTDIDRDDILLHSPLDWEVSFSQNLICAVEAAGRKRARLLQAMLMVVTRRVVMRGGPRELTSEDLAAVVRNLHSPA